MIACSAARTSRRCRTGRWTAHRSPSWKLQTPRRKESSRASIDVSWPGLRRRALPLVRRSARTAPVAVRAEDAAVTREWSDVRSACQAVEKEQARVGRDDLARLRTARRTGDDAGVAHHRSIEPLRAGRNRRTRSPVRAAGGRSPSALLEQRQFRDHAVALGDESGVRVVSPRQILAALRAPLAAPRQPDPPTRRATCSPCGVRITSASTAPPAFTRKLTGTSRSIPRL
jgi:hypothetical protein